MGQALARASLNEVRGLPVAARVGFITPAILGVASSRKVWDPSAGWIPEWDSARLPPEEWRDPQKYRVTLVCLCANDIGYGFGATVEEAHRNAWLYFKREHGPKAKAKDEIVEAAVYVGGGSHYEEVK
jgi:hypothetical protein